MGILFAVTALFAWGLGDFLIQRSARKFGDWIALFYIAIFGTVVLLPFVYSEIKPALEAHGLLLAIIAGINFVASLLDFEGLKEGKMAVVAPIFALEIPLASILAFSFLHETISLLQIVLIVATFVGIFLISTKQLHHLKRLHLEKGVWYALFAALGMGTCSFLFGAGARATSPLFVVWFSWAVLTAGTLLYLLLNGEMHQVVKDFRHHKRLIINIGFFDTLAWVSYAYSCRYVPIAVATSISEGYILLSSALGVVVNRERLKLHQYIGFFLAIIALIALALITNS